MIFQAAIVPDTRSSKEVLLVVLRVGVTCRISERQLKSSGIFLLEGEGDR